MNACVLGSRDVLTPTWPDSFQLSWRQLARQSAPRVLTTEWRTWLSNTVPAAPAQLDCVDGSQLCPPVIRPLPFEVSWSMPATVLVSHTGNAYIDWFQFDKSSRIHIRLSVVSKFSFGLYWMFEVTLSRFSVCWK